MSPPIISSERIATLLKFLDASPSPFHAVNFCRRALIAVGFIQLEEGLVKWDLHRGGKYFFIRNGSSLVAFAIGETFRVPKVKQQQVGEGEKNSGAFNIIAAHTDSPCLRIKPLSKRHPKDGFLSVAVETYGGGLWHTWFDRDLSVAGRIVTTDKEGKGLVERLVRLDAPILRIPTLAIHLDRSVHNDGFKFNTELQLLPILATETMEQRVALNEKTEEQSSLSSSSTNMMHESLYNALVSSSQTSPQEEKDIMALDLCLYDTQKATRGGIHQEFIQSARLDNLYMSFAGLCALMDCTLAFETKDVNRKDVSMLVLYDNEEVGSLSSSGAESTLLASTLTRIIAELGDGIDVTAVLPSILAKSFLISADMAHAVHPNYSDKHDECHRPQIHGGLVLKYNSNQRYTTNARSAAFIKWLARRNQIPLQEFMVRNDSPCGTTIGPIVAAKLGMLAIDVGVPQLSMHSIREMAGVDDLGHSIELFRAFFSCDRSAMHSVQSLDLFDQ